jgi:septal ring factor EnvC (AmiA/AmiB activator)
MQAATDKTSLKAQLDNLAVEKSKLQAKADGLVNKVARLKAESTKAQELAEARRLEAESREKDLHQRFRPPSISCVESFRYPLSEYLAPMNSIIG